MSRTPVYIVCSPRPGVGKTLVARLLTEFLLLRHGSVTAYDINLREPSLLDYLPQLTETAIISDTHGQMALMDRLIVDDAVPKVVDLGFHAFDDFFKMIEQIGFVKEAGRRGVEPIVLFIAGSDRPSTRGWSMLRSTFPTMKTIPLTNDYIGDPELPRHIAEAGALNITTLPAFLKSIIGRTNFSFTHYLRTNTDASSELHQWIRSNYLKFRELDDGINAPPPKRSPSR
jgi:hypothetical protein